MPELPEVEHAARVLARAAVGRRIAAVRTLHPAIARGFSPEDAARAVGRDVLGVERRGKYQLIHLGGDLVLVAHFRMAGDWQAGRRDVTPPYARAVLDFTDESAVYLVDSRAFATLLLRARGNEDLPALGPDAADPALDRAALRASLASRRGPIKPLLLDQRVVAGLGNIYAAEALWHAELNPFAAGASLDDAQLEALAGGIHHTLALAREDPGRYSRGEGLERLSVYGREGEPCTRCGTPIARVAQAGRSTYYCPGCQLGGAVPTRSGRGAVSRAPRRARP